MLVEKVTQEDLILYEILRNPVLATEFIDNYDKTERDPKFELTWYQKEILLDFSRYVSLCCGRAVGKCLHKDSIILNPRTGEYKTVAEWYEIGLSAIIALDLKTYKPVIADKPLISYNGKQTTYKIRTKSGNVTRVTEEHPFFVLNNPVKAKDLFVGAAIAIPTNMKIFGDLHLSDDDLDIILEENKRVVPDIIFTCDEDTSERYFIKYLDLFTNDYMDRLHGVIGKSFRNRLNTLFIKFGIHSVYSDTSQNRYAIRPISITHLLQKYSKRYANKFSPLLSEKYNRNSNLFFDTIVEIEKLPADDTYSVEVDTYNTLLADNFYSHNTVTVSRLIRWALVYNLFPEPENYLVLTTPGRSHLDPVFSEIVKNFRSNSFLQHFISRGSGVNNSDFVIKLLNGAELKCRIAGQTGDGRAVNGLHSPYVFLDECLPKDQLINTPDGLVQISLLSDGDKVLSWDGNTVVEDIILNIRIKELKQRVLEIETDSGISIRAGENHKLFSCGEYRELNALKISDKLYTIKDNKLIVCTIVNITDVTAEYDILYDITTSNYHNFFVNGILTKNSSFYSYGTFKELIPVLNVWTPGSRFQVSGVPDGRREKSVCYHADQENSDYSKHRISADHNPRLTPRDREKAIQDYGGEDSEDFERLWNGKHGKPVFALFDRGFMSVESYPVYKLSIDGSKLESGFTLYTEKASLLPAIPTKASRCFFGIDLGYEEPTAIYVLYSDDYERVKIHAKIDLSRVSFPIQEKFIDYLDSKFEPEFIGIDRGSGGQGISLTQHLFEDKEYYIKDYKSRLIPITFNETVSLGIGPDGIELTAKVKTFSVQILQDFTNNHKFVYSSTDVETIAELERMVYTKLPSGEHVYRTLGEAGTKKGSDHFTSALLCAMMAYWKINDALKSRAKKKKLAKPGWRV